MAHYQIEGSAFPRTTEVTDIYPDRDKSARLKDWASGLALRDLCQKLATWDEEDAGRHIHEMGRFFDEKEKPRKMQSEEIVTPWGQVVDAHKQAHREVLNFLADAGTLGHSYIERALELARSGGASLERVDAPNSDDAELLQRYALNAASNWGRWYEARAKPHGFKPLALELKLISPTLGFGGTPDCIAEYKGGVWIFDWKTSRSINRIQHGMQAVAYLALVEEEAVRIAEPLEGGGQAEKIVPRTDVPEGVGLPVRIDGVCIVRADRVETAFEHYEVPDHRIGPMWEMFKKLLEVVEHKAAFERAIRGAK